MVCFQHRTWHRVHVIAIIVVAIIWEFPGDVHFGVLETQINRHLSAFSFLGQFLF